MGWKKQHGNKQYYAWIRQQLYLHICAGLKDLQDEIFEKQKQKDLLASKSVVKWQYFTTTVQRVLKLAYSYWNGCKSSLTTFLMLKLHFNSV